MSLSFIKKVIEASEARMNNNDIKFDNNPDLLGFNNGVYDLINHEFRPYKYDDYMTMTCGYDYTDKIDKTKLQTIKTLIEQIMPDPDIRKFYLQILSAGLTG
jgi:phage/plasmid-associated DNA primase